jgi:transposase
MGKELSYKELLPNLRDLKLRSVVQTKEAWLVEAGGSSRALCPRCGVASRSRHSRYWRRLKDLPLQGASVTIKLQLGRWRCHNRKCERKIFTERVPGVLMPHAQQTVRLVLLCYKRFAPENGQHGSCRIKKPAMVRWSVAMECGLCRPREGGAAARAETLR